MSVFSIAVDIGGTFTDVVLRHEDGRVWIDKTLTTPADLRHGFFTVVQSALKQAGIGPDQVDDVIVHATTVVTNTVIERKGAPTALLTTEGFRDLLVIRDECRADIFDNQLEVPRPLVPPELTFGVRERVTADGTVLAEVDEPGMRTIARELDARGVKAVAVCLLNSYKNPVNERQVRKILLDMLPSLSVSLSSEVSPQVREYPRASTTALNAYTAPIVEPYLGGLRGKLREAGFRQDLLIMLSSGGVIGADVASRNPVRMIESGPAAGALAASFSSRLLQLDNLLSFDMGGTTAKACFIKDNSPLVTGLFEVARIYRFKPGSGLPVTLPCIDMIEIGAGGGSIASVNGLGLLTVGPQSAGSDPGPVCYGRGGAEPTVTDANVILGLIDPGNFLGGEMVLDADAADEAYQSLGRRLGIDARAAALGVYQMVDESMAAAVRSHATEKGIDWRGMPLLAFGGAGPVHACHVAELLDSDTVIFPPIASVLSAFGTLVTPIRLDLVRSELAVLSRLDWDCVDTALADMAQEGRSALLAAGIAVENVRTTLAADLRYLGQHNELTIEIPQDVIAARDTAALRQRFEQGYQHKYGIHLDDLEVEVVTWRTKVLGLERRMQPIRNMGRKMDRPVRSRTVTFPGLTCEVPVHARASLKRGQSLSGPVIVEERETTNVVLPGWNVVVDSNDCLIARRER